MRLTAALAASYLAVLAPGVAAANPGADRCGEAIALGAIPPDAIEAGMVLTPNDEDWRTFSLANPRRVRVETAGDPFRTDTTLRGYADCPSDPQRVGVAPIGDSDDRDPFDLTSSFDTACLPAGTYWIQLSNGGLVSTAPFALAVRDLGTCVPHDHIVVRVLGLEDLDGDQDGFPDTGETFDVSLEIANTSDQALADVVARIATPDPRLVCASPALLSVGSLPPGSRVTLADAVRLRVSPAAERGGSPVICAGGACSNFHVPRQPWWTWPQGCVSDAECQRRIDQEFEGSFAVRVSWPGLAAESVERVTLELDLDAGTPPGRTTTFVEGFEAGFGTFGFDNLDAGRATNDLSDGFRCAYSDPWRATCPWISGCDDEPCYLGFAAGQSPLNSWHRHTTTSPDGGRAFEGTVSVHYGTHRLGDPALDTYPLSQLDALRTTAGIRLAARVCRDDPGISPAACRTAADCVPVGGGPCVAAAPELALAHQISTMDWRSTNTPFGETPDRAVVQARVAGTGPWRTLRPFENVHDAQATAAFSNCTFDPVDDESLEDHLLPGWDPYDAPQQGPSSTCFPEFAFSYLGDTVGPFAPEQIGRASHGPGLPGSLGLGTWVESRFDLSAFRGRTIDLRLLFTSIKVYDIETAGAFGVEGGWDDGWYVDDVRVTQALAAGTPTAALDLATPPAPGTDADLDGIDDGCDNCPAIANVDQRDLDRDGAGDVCDADRDGDAVADGLDCRPTDPSLWSAPGPARELRLDGHAPTRLSWLAPEAPGAVPIAYGVIRRPSAADASLAECLGTTASFAAEDAAPAPAAGAVRFYLVATRNSCGVNAGSASSGTPRTPAPCF